MFTSLFSRPTILMVAFMLQCSIRRLFVCL